MAPKRRSSRRKASAKKKGGKRKSARRSAKRSAKKGSKKDKKNKVQSISVQETRPGKVLKKGKSKRKLLVGAG